MAVAVPCVRCPVALRPGGNAIYETVHAATVRLRDLEMLLEKHVAPFPAPDARLEQYRTPADIAAHLLFEAFQLGDLEGRDVLDLGCGTGMLSLGAALLGARVKGVDVDAAAVALASASAKALGVDAAFEARDVRELGDVRADVVLTNPPFGAQVPGADRPFLAAAFRAAPVAYVFANPPGAAFVEARATEAGYVRTHGWDVAFEVPHLYAHHTRARQIVPVKVFRFVRMDVE